ncbi:pentapeptide repeat-containing protein [Kitasatospora sp. NPDC006786]|uniref:pentapeptide repeat-containing protein n=1 Tax=unclassified Kitasatospora TaxID=2633591 RepID=UPI0033E8BFFA
MVGALHGLYRGAGKPSLREISDGIRQRGDLPTTVSHDTASQLLHGVTVPSWARVESIVRYLADAAVGRQKPDPEAEVERFHRLWLDAEDADPATPTRPATADAADAELSADLRSPDQERRIAALYRLERRAWRTPSPGQEDSAPPWLTVLAHFLRTARPLGVPGDPVPAPAEEVQLAALILGRLPVRHFAGPFDLSGLDLRHLTWEGARLSHADLSGSLLSGSSLRFARLGKARLTEATLTDADLEAANLFSADLTRCDLTRASLVDTSLKFADLSHVALLETDLDDASAPLTRWEGCSADQADFRRADLTQANFTGAVLTNCSFLHAKLVGAFFTDADLRGSSFSGADLSGALFTRSSLATAQLTPEQLASIEVVREPDGSIVPT